MLWPQFAEQSDKEGWPAARFLAAIAEHEIAERGRRRIERHLVEARLPAGRTFDSFDFEAVPIISKAQVTALAAGDGWLGKGANLLLFGPPGGGKSHLAAASSLALIENGWRVLFTRATDLVQKLQVARRELNLEAAINRLDRFAAIDRLVHHATIVEMNVESYRRCTALERKRGPGRPPSHASPKLSLIDAPRQSAKTKLLRATILAAIITSLRHRLAILIVARFPPRLSRYTARHRAILLTGLAVCPCCKGAMILRTGASKSGKVHRYYACSTTTRKVRPRVREAAFPWIGLTVPSPARLSNVSLRATASGNFCQSWQNAELSAGRPSMPVLRRSPAKPLRPTKLRHLYQLVESGTAEMDELLKERIGALKAERERASEALTRAKDGVRAKSEITPEAAERFGALMRERILEGATPS